MSETAGPPEERDARLERIEKCKRRMAEVYWLAYLMLRKGGRIKEDRAFDCLNTAVKEMLSRWEKGVPPDVGNWAGYLAHAAGHVNIRPRRNDERIIVHIPTGPDGKPPRALDEASNDPDPSEDAARWEEHALTLDHLFELPWKQVQVVILWTLGFSFAEIGKKLGITASYARALKCRAINTLRKKRGMSDSA